MVLHVLAGFGGKLPKLTSLKWKQCLTQEASVRVKKEKKKEFMQSTEHRAWHILVLGHCDCDHYQPSKSLLHVLDEMQEMSGEI